MTTLQSLQASRDEARKNSFSTYARNQWRALFKDEEESEIKKSFDKFRKDTKDFCLLITAKVEDNVLNPTTFAKIATAIDENGKTTATRQLYAINFEAESFADVDKVTAYYVDNYLTFVSASVAFRKEAKERAKREEAKKAANAIKKQIEELRNQIFAAVRARDYAKVEELNALVDELSK